MTAPCSVPPVPNLPVIVELGANLPLERPFGDHVSAAAGERARPRDRRVREPDWNWGPAASAVERRVADRQSRHLLAVSRHLEADEVGRSGRGELAAVRSPPNRVRGERRSRETEHAHGYRRDQCTFRCVPSEQPHSVLRCSWFLAWAHDASRRRPARSPTDQGSGASAHNRPKGRCLSARDRHSG